MAATFVNKWHLDEAVQVCEETLRINPSDIPAHYVLGNILMTRGRHEEAELYFRRAIQINPNELKSYQALLMLTSYCPKFDAEAILMEHLRFAQQFEEPLRPNVSPHLNERSIDRRLKIGYQRMAPMN